MKLDRKQGLSLVMVGALLLLAGVAAAVDVPLKNWAPARFPAATSRTPLLSDIGAGGVIFVPVTPCRVVDTRGGAPFTGGIYAAAESRDYQINAAAAPCNGIPTGVAAYSLNFTVTQALGSGFLAVYPRGGPPSPLVSTINYVAGQTIANAAIVPADSSGFITVVAGVSGTHVIIDINGYYIGGNATIRLNSGEYLGVNGDYAGGGIIFSRNWNTTSSSGLTSALRGYMATTQAGPAAVLGEQGGGSGANYGVKGTNSSPTAGAAGVYGLGASGAPHANYRTALSTGGVGVVALGILALSATLAFVFWPSESTTARTSDDGKHSELAASAAPTTSAEPAKPASGAATGASSAEPKGALAEAKTAQQQAAQARKQAADARAQAAAARAQAEAAKKKALESIGK
jgi:hypothetical protein